MPRLPVAERPETPERTTSSTSPVNPTALSRSPFLDRSNLLRSPGLWLSIAAGAFGFFNLFLFPNLPIWTGGDQAIILEDAKRMLNGEALYGDFFQMTFPATQLYYLSLFKLFGPRTWIPNLTLGVLGVALALLIYLVSTRILPPRYAVLPALIWLTLIFHEKLDATHHWFAILAVLSALVVLLECRTPRRIFAAGTLCGLAACFTQSHGVAALLAFGLFLFLQEKTHQDSSQSFTRNCAFLLAGFSLPVVLIVGPFLLQAGWSRFVYCTFIFLFKYYHAFQVANDWHGYLISQVPLLHSGHVWRLGAFMLVHALVPLIYVLMLVRHSRSAFRNDSVLRSRLLLISLLGLFLFFGVASTPTWSRLYYISSPALVLFVWWVNGTGKVGQPVLTGLYAATFLLLIGFPIAKQVRSHHVLDLPGGRTAFLNAEQFERYRWVAEHTHPGNYFFGGFYPDFYFLLGLNNPAKVPFITPDDYTRPRDVADAMEGLEIHHVGLVIWQNALDLPPIPAADHLGPLRAYLHQHYRLVKNSSEYEAWARTE
ncbi:MAG: hypothetical protein ACHQT6_00705 [Candidatus Acidiferrales bacterium]